MGITEQSHIAGDTRQTIREHAQAEYPKEACGFIVRIGEKQRAIPCVNSSLEPERRFRIAGEEWLRAEATGEIIAVYHSHTNEPPTPSPGDKTQAEAHELPFVIIGWPTDAWDVYVPNGWEAPLLGRPFLHGSLDCFGLVRDAYRQRRGIIIPDFEREDEWWNPLKELPDGTQRRTDIPGKIIAPPMNLYLDNFKAAGFVEVSDLRTDDALIIQMPRSPVANHCALYEGNGMMIHHLSDRISTREPYLAGHGYARYVDKIVRHESLC